MLKEKGRIMKRNDAVSELKNAGFTDKQAELIMKLLYEILNSGRVKENNMNMLDTLNNLKEAGFNHKQAEALVRTHYYTVNSYLQSIRNN